MYLVSKSRKRGTSPVIASVLLSAVVLSVGVSVWFYCQSASTAIANDYVEGVIGLIGEISERFTVERVGYDGASLRVWIYNYGEVGVVVDVYADVTSVASDPYIGKEAPSGALVDVYLDLVDVSGCVVIVKVVSRRGNRVCYRYFAPQRQ